MNTHELQSAIDACASRGGGTVVVPAGEHEIGAIFLRDQITLHLEAGAVLLGSQNFADYPIISARWEGREQLTHAPLICGQGLRNIAITGRGTIDGRGAPWWSAQRAKTLDYPRPRLIGLSECNNVLIEGVTLTNSPAWTVNPVRCENVNVRGVSIINPPDSPNTDGINPDSCRMVRISDCFVSVGDDCITIKSGVETERPDLLWPCRDITITNCTLERGHGGVVIGSETSGSVQNVTISNCVLVGTDRGIRMKTRRGRGGVVENVRVTNLVMDGVLTPFTMNLYYNCGGAKGDRTVSDKNARAVDAGTPAFRNIHFSHITAVDVKLAAGFFYGLAEMPLEDISLSDVSITMSAGAEADLPEMADDIPSMSQAGIFIRNARGIKLNQVEVKNQMGPAVDADDSVSGLKIG